MAFVDELARRHPDLEPADLDRLRRLVADWQLLADLSFADLVLWLESAEGYRAAAQMRPTTGPTTFEDDVVGQFLRTGAVRRMLDSAVAEGRVVREGDPEWFDEVPVRIEAIPVRRGSRVIGVVARYTNLHGVRTPSRLELTYLQTASELAQMIAAGTYPHPDRGAELPASPRVGDGFVRVDARGLVTYTSPNALSVFRRLGLLGDLTGEDLAALARDLVPAAARPAEETMSAVLSGKLVGDIELDNGSAAISVRSVPLRPAGEPTGAMVLVRDVTELRRRDRELVTKDATIREIHHRVKNNLQTVAALLRLQARRLDEPTGRAALEEAVRRVGSIAVVHETLSQGTALDSGDAVAFDEVADRLRRAVAGLGAAGQVRTEREGSFGTLDAAIATPLAMALTELLHNAVEHGFGPEGEGRIDVRVARSATELAVEVLDDGVGLPDDFEAATGSLGLSIVSTLVTELGGSLAITPRDGTGGASARIVVPIPR